MAKAPKNRTPAKKTYVFDDILSKGIRAGQVPARTQDARKWFRDTARKTTVAPNTQMSGDPGRLRNKVAMGRMYAFFYDPKHKKTLPYYDRFPLIFPVQPAPGGFLGMNLHYLPLPLRAKMMDALYNVTSNERFDQSTRLKLTYNLLQAATKGIFKPTIKHYLSAHVKSRFLLIEAAEWDIALFLPTERFDGASKTKVWKDSRAMI